MNIAIIGANSQVGTELCFLLRNEHANVIPIVRNRIGAAFLSRHQFSCRIADASREDDARIALRDADVAVLAAYMWPTLTVPARVNSETNKRIVEHCARFSRSGATVIYLSSIRAFSKKIDKSMPRWGIKPAYDHEKLMLERLFLRQCRRFGKRGYVFRLGHVFGKHQAITKNVRRVLQHPSVRVSARADLASNVVHTVTLMNAIMECAKASAHPGRYTIVNAPQWTWREVIHCYKCPSTTVTFISERPTKRWRVLLWRLAQRPMRHYARLRFLLPECLDEHIQYLYRKKKVAKEIDMLELEPVLRLSGFAYREAPGPFLQTLEKTKELLRTKDLPELFFLIDSFKKT